ncbi:MAG TPA: division/cell wall cluster transcriptional repressor MraZ [Bacteroidetes bacterium]|nr:division/cell wall cluster transcriptional repressor MraZ [Bacteroidota bacterium]
MYRILETFVVKPDAKGRIALPSALRKALGGEVAGGFFIRRSMQETCLEMYTSRMWEEELGKIQRLNPYVREHRDFIRRFMAGVRFVEADAVGRVNIPADLAVWAHFEREVVLSPVGNFFELWDKDLYEQALGRGESSYAELAERLMGSAGKEGDGSSREI